MAPLVSTITLFTEIIVLISILYTFYSSYFKNRFPRLLVAITLIYETIFNIGYMVYRTVAHSDVLTGNMRTFAILHGILSLVMFILLIVLMSFAWQAYRKENFFRKNKCMTITFLVFWIVSVTSGIYVYFLAYY
jgi:hypothetical protein